MAKITPLASFHHTYRVMNENRVLSYASIFLTEDRISKEPNVARGCDFNGSRGISPKPGEVFLVVLRTDQ
ncbi:MAG: hypothetical protein V5A87_03665 [Candidatus Bipolaricaulota bacterium]|nr:hypothetical protein [Candidatus Bipolaricaulota bacterium]MBS3791776.1 hypothetical protein [Candidatus Bipolaricaulota bacterium]